MRCVSVFQKDQQKKQDFKIKLMTEEGWAAGVDRYTDPAELTCWKYCILEKMLQYVITQLRLRPEESLIVGAT